MSSYYAFAPHIAHRKQIYMWPTPFAAVDWGTFKQEGKRLPQAKQVQYLLLPPQLDDHAGVFQAVKGDFTELDRGVNDLGQGAVLYKRTSPSPTK